MIYLDNSATTRPFDEVAAQMVACMQEGYANPSSLYGPGLAVERQLRAVREQLRALAHAPGYGVTFVSGGTEANNLALRGSLPKVPQGHILTTVMEHPSVLEVFRSLEQDGWEVGYLPVTPEGQVTPEALSGALRPDTRLVSIMQVNNETGALQDVRALGAALREHPARPLFHVDGVQAFLRVPVDLASWGVDLYTVSAHKLHGPKGVGALLHGPRVRLRPLVYGGGQEAGLRSGTENVPGILGLGAALSQFQAHGEAWRAQLRAMKVALGSGILQRLDGVHVNGPAMEAGAPHILSLSLEGVRGETLLHSLEAEGIYVSTGSACSSHKKGVSPVLLAHGVPQSLAEGAIRISLSPMNRPEDMDAAAEAVARAARHLRKFRRK